MAGYSDPINHAFAFAAKHHDQQVRKGTRYPYLTAELLRRGYTDSQVKKIIGGNILRVMRQVESVAAKLQRSRPASAAWIEDLDH